MFVFHRQSRDMEKYGIFRRVQFAIYDLKYASPILSPSWPIPDLDLDLYVIVYVQVRAQLWIIEPPMDRSSQAVFLPGIQRLPWPAVCNAGASHAPPAIACHNRVHFFILTIWFGTGHGCQQTVHCSPHWVWGGVGDGFQPTAQTTWLHLSHHQMVCQWRTGAHHRLPRCPRQIGKVLPYTKDARTWWADPGFWHRLPPRCYLSITGSYRFQCTAIRLIVVSFWSAKQKRWPASTCLCTDFSLGCTMLYRSTWTTCRMSSLPLWVVFSCPVSRICVPPIFVVCHYLLPFVTVGYHCLAYRTVR